MGRKNTPLRGSSEIVLQDGSVLPVRDEDGNLQMDAARWAEYQSGMMERVGRIVSDIVTAHPERRAAFGLQPGVQCATLSLHDVLGTAGHEKAPDSAATPSGASE